MLKSPFIPAAARFSSPSPALACPGAENPFSHVLLKRETLYNQTTGDFNHTIDNQAPHHPEQDTSLVIEPSSCYTDHPTAEMLRAPPPNFARSRDRVTAMPLPQSPPRAPRISAFPLCEALPDLRSFTAEDLEAVVPLLQMGRAFEPQRGLFEPSRGFEPSREPCSRREQRPRRRSRRRKSCRDTLEFAPEFASLYEPSGSQAFSSSSPPPEPELVPVSDASHIAVVNRDSLRGWPPQGKHAWLGSAGSDRPSSHSSLPSPPASPPQQHEPLPALSSALPQRSRLRIEPHKVCVSCGTSKTPCWRPCWDPQLGRLCNSCGLRYRKSRARCPKCIHIPSKTELAEARARVTSFEYVCCPKCCTPLELLRR